MKVFAWRLFVFAYPWLVALLTPAFAVVRGVSLVRRSLVALVTLPIVIVDERVTRINLMRTENQTAVTEANLNVARIGEILASRGRSDAGRECLDAVIRAVIPKPVEVPPPKLRNADDAAVRLAEAAKREFPKRGDA